MDNDAETLLNIMDDTILIINPNRKNYCKKNIIKLKLPINTFHIFCAELDNNIRKKKGA